MRKSIIRKSVATVIMVTLVLATLPVNKAQALQKGLVLVKDTAGAVMDGETITYPAGTETATTCVSFTLEKTAVVTMKQEFKMCRALNPWYYDKNHPEERNYRDAAYQLQIILSSDPEGSQVISQYNDEAGMYIMPLDGETLDAGTYYYTIKWRPAEEESASDDWTAVSLNDVRFYWNTYGADYQGYIDLSLQETEPKQELPKHTTAPYIGTPTQEDLDILQGKKDQVSIPASEKDYSHTQLKTVSEREEVEDMEADKEDIVTIKWSKVKKASRYIVKEKNEGNGWVNIAKTKKALFAEAKSGRKYRIDAQKKVKGRYKTIKKVYISSK